MADEPQKSFEESSSEKELSLGQEILEMLRHNKKWWLIPIILVLALFGLLLVLGSTGAAPFIYTLF
jgi:drug/metabolite transporter superfamily protein YnfA